VLIEAEGDTLRLAATNQGISSVVPPRWTRQGEQPSTPGPFEFVNTLPASRCAVNGRGAANLGSWPGRDAEINGTTRIFLLSRG
jgi:hypothetical protein